MKNFYLRVLAVTLSLAIGGTAAFTYVTDAFGIYGDVTETSLSRVDQFYYMRKSKPLIILNKQPQNLIAGSSRAARLNPMNSGLNNYYNASIPGATPTEIRKLIEFSHAQKPLQSVLIGWDFESFLSLTPPFRDGFNSKLITATNPIDLAVQTTVSHMRTLVSFTAILENVKASTAENPEPSTSYFPDGSWHRNLTSQQVESGVLEISKQKTKEFRDVIEHRIDTTEIHSTLELCYRKKINCQVFATPVHLVHFEIFSRFRLVGLWRKWHWEIVKINQKLARKYNQKPITFWGFNATIPAVNSMISNPASLEEPWYEDNLHFHPRFGNIILQATLFGRANKGATQLTPSNLNSYLNEVARLQKKYISRDAAMVKSLRRSLNIMEADLH